MSINSLCLHNECVACGLLISCCESDGTIQFLEPDSNNIAPLILSAHNKPLSSDECLALQSALTEDQWLAYQDARKAPVRAQRAERYRQEADPVYLKITEDAIKANTTPDYSEWVTIKDQIRTELPYPE